MVKSWNNAYKRSTHGIDYVKIAFLFRIIVVKVPGETARGEFGFDITVEKYFNVKKHSSSNFNATPKDIEVIALCGQRTGWHEKALARLIG